MTALAAMQEHILTPYNSLACTGSYKVAGQTFKNWDPGVSAMMTLPTALAQSCDTYFYQVGKAFYDLPPDRGQPLQRWAKTFGFGQPTGIDVGPESAGLLPTIDWKRATFTKKTDPCCWEVDRLWKPGDSIQLAIGQKDMLASPLQMARFYALLANGGKLVKPHLVSAIEQGGGSTTGPAQGSPIVLRRYQPAAKELNLDPAAIDVIRQGLYEATHSPNGTSSGVFGHFPIAIAGKTGTAEKSIDAGTYMRLEDTAWWCGWGPYEKPELVVCAVIENGGFGGEVAAPAALQVFEEYFGVEAARSGREAGGLMVDYAATQRVATRPRARAREASFLRNVDWVLLFAVGGIVAYGLWVVSGITKDDVAGDPNYYVARQAAFALIGVAGMVGMTLIDPGFWRKHARLVYGLLLFVLVADPDPRDERQEHAALDRHRRVPLPAVRVREAPARPVPRRVPRRARQADLRAADDDCGDRARRGADAARLPAARLRDGDRLRGDPRRGSLHRRDALVARSRSCSGSAPSSRRSSCGSARRSASTC